MRAPTTRRIVFLAGGLLIAALLLVTAGIALAWGGGNPPYGASQGSPGMHGGMGPGMGSVGSSGACPGGAGGMMGGNGHGMMGGNGQCGQSQNPAGTPSVGVNRVAIQNFAYQPANVSVKVGTTVTWTNQDSAPHTVTFKNGMKDSGMLRQGQSFSYTFTAAGAYSYYCAYHTYMVGAITVTA